jgi:hypothetical protein
MKAQKCQREQLQCETLIAIKLSIATGNRGNAMIRYAASLLVLALAAAPAAAANYSATLTTPASGRFIARDIVWTCGAAACQGATDESRPVVLCESLAKRAGRVERFLVDGQELPRDELARCNAMAKTQPGTALAAK